MLWGLFLLEKENREKRGSIKYVHSMQSTGLIIHIINIFSVDSCYDMCIYVMAILNKCRDAARVKNPGGR